MALAVNSLGGRQRSPSRHSSRSTPDAEEFNVSRDSDLFNFNECLEKGIPSRLCIEVTGSNSEIPKNAHVHYNGEL
ncbi:DEKNAAC101287, partial [Brettanomyces naardenensis]